VFKGSLSSQCLETFRLESCSSTHLLKCPRRLIILLPFDIFNATNKHCLHLTGDVDGVFLDREHAGKDELFELLPLGVQILKSVPQLLLVFGTVGASEWDFLMNEECCSRIGRSQGKGPSHQMLNTT
jgi:hypothetical protein